MQMSKVNCLIARFVLAFFVVVVALWSCLIGKAV